MGRDIDIPSGILCNAIAIDKVIPNFKLCVVAMYVAIPSGILCIMMAIIDITPTLYKLSLLGINLSINIDIIIPILILINKNIMDIKLGLNSLILSGIKSNIDTVNITPAANDKAVLITLSSFLKFININIVPIIVESPAIIVSKKAISSPVKYMKKDNI